MFDERNTKANQILKNGDSFVVLFDSFLRLSYKPFSKTISSKWLYLFLLKWFNLWFWFL